MHALIFDLQSRQYFASASFLGGDASDLTGGAQSAYSLCAKHTVLINDRHVL